MPRILFAPFLHPRWELVGMYMCEDECGPDLVLITQVVAYDICS